LPCSKDVLSSILFNAQPQAPATRHLHLLWWPAPAAGR